MDRVSEQSGRLIDPHAGQPTLHAGPRNADGVLVLIHGRGATAESILPLYDELGMPSLSAVAPQAAGNSWYPQSFLAPLDANQPYLDSALRRVGTLIDELVSGGTPIQHIALFGFSQGACLATEFAARNPHRYGAIIGLSGGLIGPPGTPRDYGGSFDSTPIFLGGSDPDPHVPFSRVEETAAILNRMGAKTELRRYPGLPHTINDDELDACRHMLAHMILEIRP